MITPSKVKFYTLRDKVDSRALLLLFFQVRKKVKMLTAFLCLSKGKKLPAGKNEEKIFQDCG
jgi:hypothetical protein